MDQQIQDLEYQRESKSNHLKDLIESNLKLKSQYSEKNEESIRNEIQKVDTWIGNLSHWVRSNITLELDHRKISEINLGPAFVNKVKGKVYSFFKSKHPDFDKAVNCMAKPHMFKTVVDDADTAEMILKYNLQRGTKVLLPLDKLRVPGFASLAKRIVTNQNIHDQDNQKTPDLIVISKARSLVKNCKNAEVWLPHELIEYEPKDQKLVSFVFSNYLVTSNMDVGMVICDALNIRCVTIDGEKVEPGTLSGGFQSESQNLLQIAHDYVKRETKKRKLYDILKQNQAWKTQETLGKEQQRTLQSEIKTLEAQKERLTESKKNLQDDNLDSRLELKQKEIQRTRSRVQDLQQKAQSRNQELKQLQKDNKTKRKTVNPTQMKDEIQKQQHHIQKMEQKILENESREHSIRNQITTHTKETENKKHQLVKLKQEFQQEKAKLEEEQNQKTTIQRRLNELLFEQNQLIEKNSKIQRKKTEMENQLKQLETQKKNLHKELENIENDQKRLHGDLIKHQESLRNMNSSPRRSIEEHDKKRNSHPQELDKEIKDLINVTANDPIEVVSQKASKIQTRILKLEHDLKTLRRTVNLDSEDHFLKLEKDFTSIRTNREVVQVDRVGITSNILNINAKKYFRVQKCFEQVNYHLQEMFSSLVPGAKARMVLKNYPPKETEYVNDRAKGI